LLLYTSDRLSQAVEEVTTNKDKLSTQCRQISVYEQEIGLRRKQLEALEIDREKDRRKIDEVRQVLTRTREVRISRTRSMSLSLLSTVSAACDDTYMYSVSQKIPLRGPDISHFSHKRLRIFNRFFTYLLHVPIYARSQIFIQFSPTLTKLCHIKRDYPVHIICTKCPKRTKTRAFRRLRKSLIALLIVVCGK